MADEGCGYLEAYILDDGGRSGLDGLRTFCGKYRGVDRVYAEWFSPEDVELPLQSVSRCRACAIQRSMARRNGNRVKRPVHTKSRHRRKGGNLQVRSGCSPARRTRMAC